MSDRRLRPRNVYATPMSSAGRLLGVAASSARTVGNLYNAGRRAGSAFQRAARAVQQERRRTVVQRNMYKGGPGTHFGTYAGKLKGAKDKKYDEFSRMSINGVVNRLENYTTISDPEFVGCSHSTFCHNLIKHSIAEAVVKKLLNKMGIYPSNHQDNITQDNMVAPGMIFRLLYTVNGVSSQLDHIVAAAHTLEVVASTFYPVIEVFLTSGTGENRLRAIQLYSNSTGFPVINQVYLDSMKMVVVSKSNIKVQNRSKGHSAPEADSDADRVDNQPLVGTIVKCSGGVPVIRQYDVAVPAGIKDMQQILKESGTSTVLGNDLDSGDREPFKSSYFLNGKSQNKVYLDAGSIKNSQIYYKWTGYLNNYFKAIKVIIDSTETSKLVSAPGVCEIITLEEQLNTGIGNPLVLAAEHEVSVGVNLIYGPKSITRVKTTFSSNF